MHFAYIMIGKSWI